MIETSCRIGRGKQRSLLFCCLFCLFVMLGMVFFVSFFLHVIFVCLITCNKMVIENHLRIRSRQQQWPAVCLFVCLVIRFVDFFCLIDYL